MIKRNISLFLSSAVVLLGLGAYLLSAQTAMAQASPLYAQCQGCHQPTGAGIPGVFPPLAGHVPEILAAKGGREYLIQVLLYGLQGQIAVKGTRYQGVMPAYAQLKDEDIAGLLNHISTQWGNKFPAGQQPFTAAEVRAQRAKTLTAAQVLEARNKLGLK
ncbi:cytochrome c class I [Meiothermus ruber DSM 1279]|uniref:Cytochrome c class I n=2 Tax=Meiothermus ruber TaxID=277 RepID=D3PPK5_MEIRD|nr:cytochrome c class I [Meiothermus ruber DSM 1279]AGK04928.1 cytochrome c class I [Meiothermus ruber DSM 1279]